MWAGCWRWRGTGLRWRCPVPMRTLPRSASPRPGRRARERREAGGVGGVPAGAAGGAGGVRDPGGARCRVRAGAGQGGRGAGPGPGPAGVPGPGDAAAGGPQLLQLRLVERRRRHRRGPAVAGQGQHAPARDPGAARRVESVRNSVRGVVEHSVSAGHRGGRDLGEVKMTMLEAPAGEVEDPEAGFSGELGEGDGGGALVLPEDVVAELAGRLAGRAGAGGPVALTGPGGLLSGIIGQVLQAGLAAELDGFLDGDAAGNRRNGSSAKTLNTEVGPVRIAVPRDRDGSFDPVLVPKQATRSDGLNAVITSLYAKGMSVRDIARHVRQTTGVDLSHDTVSRVTDGALEGMREWQHRPLEPFYPVIYVDALVAKVRDGAAVRNKAVNIAVGI